MNDERKKPKWYIKEKRVNDLFQENMYQCKKCGRKEIIRFDKGKKLCSHCGNYIFKNDKEEFKFKLGRLIK